MNNDDWISRIKCTANRIRYRVMEHSIKNNGGYLSQACSSAEIFASLYIKIMNLGKVQKAIIPQNFNKVPGNDNKNSLYGFIYNGEKNSIYDRFFLSPSQYSLVLYSVLIETHRMDEEGLSEFNKDGSIVEMIGAEHSPGMEIMSGSLGQGISQAGGIALGRKLKKDIGKVFIFMSDGEFQIGQTWEAIQSFCFLQLNNIYVYIDINGYQCDGRMSEVMNIEPLDKKLEAFGARVFRINGHDINAIVECGLMQMDESKPTFILCDTIPYKGIEILKKREPKYHYLRFTNLEEINEYKEYLKKLKKNMEN